MALPEFSMRQLLEAGAHFGHRQQRWNPKMAPFIYGQRNDIHILDLTQSVPLLHQALVTLREIAAGGGRILFVGTKRQASEPIAAAAKRCAQYYVNHRWLGGYPMRVHVTEAGKKSPITKGVEDFVVVDEHHFVTYKFEPAPPNIGPEGPVQTSFWTTAPHVLFESVSVDNTLDPEVAQYGAFGKDGKTALIGGWARDIGKGRMVFMAPGHMIEVMQHPMMQKLYRNAMLWLAHEDEAGAAPRRP